MADKLPAAFDTFDKCNQIIERGKQTFMQVGAAFQAVRAMGWWKLDGNHDTFDAWCRDRHGFSSSRVRQLVSSAKKSALLARKSVTMVTPTSERRVRELAKLDDEEDQAEAWDEAVEEAGGQAPTQSQVGAAVQSVLHRVGKRGSDGQTQKEPPRTKKKAAKKAGGQKATVAQRKEALAAFGKLVRALHALGIKDKTDKHMEAVEKAIKGVK